MAQVLATIPLSNPKTVPSQLILRGTHGDDTTGFYLNDADGIASQIAAFTGKVELVSGQTVNTASIKEFLKTYALVVGGFNFQSSDSTQLTNNLNLIRSCIDGTQKRDQIFSASTVSNMQQNPNLLNINIPFIWDNTTALEISAASTSDADYTFTFRILAAVPYGQLDAYLAATNIQQYAETCSCVPKVVG